MSYLDGLNAQQREAVLHKNGPLLILAGAGSGKTRVITHRMLHLMKDGVRPGSILAITFTNKAAKEMRERVMHLIKNDATLNLPVSFQERPFVSTFHALGVHIIRENAERLGLPRHFSIFDKSDAQSATKEALNDLGVDTKQFSPSKLHNAISRHKGDFITLAGDRGRGKQDY